jgi:tetratricopeptide (TPR) repeat protein
VAGGVLALLGLSRENALIIALVVPAWIWLYYAASPRPARLKGVLLFFAGLFVTLLPVAWRNLAVGGEFALTTSQLGPNFFIGNNPLADGTYASVRIAHGLPQFEQKEAILLAEKDVGGPLTSRQVSNYWLARSWQFIRSQPGGWAGLLARKWLIVWNAKEIEDSDDYYLYQRWSPLLEVSGWINHFGFLAPLAVSGIFLTRSDWRRLWLLYAVLLALAGSIALFYVFGRYRISLVPILAVFAGAGIVQGFSLWRERRVREGIAGVFLFALSAAAVRAPVVGNAGPSAGGYNNLSNALVKQGRVNDAIESLQQALKLQADYGAAHYNLGNLYVATGKIEEGVFHLKEAIRLYPRFAEAHSNLGTTLAQRGDLQAAIEEFRRALEINPAAGGVHINLGVALANQGNLAAAADSFERELALHPESAQAHYYLGNVMAAAGRFEEAIEHFRQVLRIEPEFADARRSLARALAMQGKKG